MTDDFHSTGAGFSLLRIFIALLQPAQSSSNSSRALSVGWQEMYATAVPEARLIHNGSALFSYEAKRPDVVWDYREYDMQLDNLILKGEIGEIAEGYSAFEAYL